MLVLQLHKKNPAVTLHSTIDMNVPNPLPPFSGFGASELKPMLLDRQLLLMVPWLFLYRILCEQPNAAVKPSFLVCHYNSLVCLINLLVIST